MFLAELLTVLLFIHSLVSPTDQSYLKQKDYKERVKYSIMFDAGSTGSRMHIFQFRIGLDDKIRLENETYHRISPGLSHYASNPAEGAKSFRPMLNKAQAVVPLSEQPTTPLVLKATAGLRLLPATVQTQLLNEMRDTFSQYPFQSDYESVGIMDGKHEGFYAWLMVVFTLNEKLDKNSIATLDLGGGSTQITFQPQADTTLSKIDHLSKFKMPQGAKQTMYAHSYLGGGLMYGRAEMLKRSVTSKNETHFNVASPCIHPDIADEADGGLYWDYFGTSFIVQPDGAGRFSFEACYPLAKSYIAELNVFAPQELPSLKLYLMSYYFDRAIEADLIHEGVETHKELTVRDFRDRADSECRHHSTHLEKNEFLCLDLTYIYALLHNGLKLPDNTKITVAKKLHGSEVSWALGAALSQLEL